MFATNTQFAEVRGVFLDIFTLITIARPHCSTSQTRPIATYVARSVVCLSVGRDRVT